MAPLTEHRAAPYCAAKGAGDWPGRYDTSPAALQRDIRPVASAKPGTFLAFERWAFSASASRSISATVQKSHLKRCLWRKVVAYYRVSIGKQGRSGLGLDAQRSAVQSFIEASGSWPPVAEFTETESGRKVDRKQLATVLAACRVHRAVLVIAKLDRLSPNQSFLMALIGSGVDVLFCDLPQIPAGAVGRFMLQQMSAVAELEAGLISERTKAALAAKVARDGQWDRRAKHHLVAGVGQKAATEAVRSGQRPRTDHRRDQEGWRKLAEGDCEGTHRARHTPAERRHERLVRSAGVTHYGPPVRAARMF